MMAVRAASVGMQGRKGAQKSRGVAQGEASTGQGKSGSSSSWDRWPEVAGSLPVTAGGPQGRASYDQMLSELHALVSNGPVLGPSPDPASSATSAGGPAVQGGGGQPEISVGSTGPAVVALQQRLTALGFNPQGIDGIFGPHTEAAVKAFQTSQGISVDGIVGPQTWGRLDNPSSGAPAPAAPPAPASRTGSGPLLQFGSTGPAVVALQQRLAALGFNPQGIDGDFGPNTQAAVKAFQASRGIQVDGIVGPQTWGQLGITVSGNSGGSSPPPSNFQSAIVAGAESLVASGYMYPPNDTSQYYYVPDKVGCCADFACDAIGKAGFNLNGTMTQLGMDPHYCPSIIDYLKAHQQYIPAGQGPAHVGDMVFFDWGDGQADHVAIVTQVNAQGVPTQIAESYTGNTPAHITSGVSVNDIMGYGRIVNT